MQNPDSFTIYNASAGSGKTYTLVKEYLKILLASNNQYLFKNILAITFTNKAVAEMKERIVDTLKIFANNSVLQNPTSMLLDISRELNEKPENLHEKSKRVLNTILHNYSAFEVSTIDGFTHKLIRTFAHDLKLPLNFEVELDQNSLLNEAVDSLISKAGTNAELTKVLVDFAIEKTDDDKSWDISFDLNKVAKLLVNENDIPYLDSLKDKSLDDFKNLKVQLKRDIAKLEQSIVITAQSTIDLIAEAGLEFNDFTSSYLPNHFKKLSKKIFDVNFEAKWQEDIENKTLYPKRVSADIASIIETIKPEIVSSFNQTKADVFKLKFLKNIYKNITPLSVLQLTNGELKALKVAQNKMLISEFNTIINNEIKNQPTPFIYERIGEKFDHYFIDEFQDTSIKQWNNLKPLLENTLSKEDGSVTIVGDAKQAIYRWRGGKAEQFIDLFNKNDIPFPVEQNMKDLQENHRSFKEIVGFNNGLFSFLSENLFSNLNYKFLYKQAKQELAKKEEGYVELSFLDIDKDDDKYECYANQVLKTINNCLLYGFSLKDICVLVRKKKEGVAIAKYLTENEIPIISSETLLLSSSPEVNFANNLLTLLTQPRNQECKITVLNSLAEFLNIEDKHSFFVKHIDLSLSQLFSALKSYKIHLNIETLLKLPLYDLVETILREFKLLKHSNAYVQFYLDIVLDFSQKKGTDILEFLSYFKSKQDDLSIVSPVGQNAIQIMTIHKSKGLQFPIVIFPFADLNMFKELEPKEWFPLDKDLYQGFPFAPLTYNKDFDNFGEIGKSIYLKHQSELELDAVNILYVALTRPVEQLYIISKNEAKLNNENKWKTYSGLLISYLNQIGLWDSTQSVYKFGNPKKATQAPSQEETTIISRDFISTAKETHNIHVVTKSGLLWDTDQGDAIEKGNLIHNIMSKIFSEQDVKPVLSEYTHDGIINLSQAEQLELEIKQIVSHPKLKAYYSPKVKVYNERDIITKNGLIFRPDRVVINKDNQAVIIDYKTGVEEQKHTQQLLRYQEALEEMDFFVKEKILIYFNEMINLKIV